MVKRGYINIERVGSSAGFVRTTSGRFIVQLVTAGRMQGIKLGYNCTHTCSEATTSRSTAKIRKSQAASISTWALNEDQHHLMASAQMHSALHAEMSAAGFSYFRMASYRGQKHSHSGDAMTNLSLADWYACTRASLNGHMTCHTSRHMSAAQMVTPRPHLVTRGECSWSSLDLSLP
jgi:hypothetical protein